MCTYVILLSEVLVALASAQAAGGVLAIATKPPVCDIGEACSVAGSSCSRGIQTCCGQTYDEFQCTCEDVGGGILQYVCLYTDSCLVPSCCLPGPPVDKAPPADGTCDPGQLCDTGIEGDYCCHDVTGGSDGIYCTISGGTTISPSSSPTTNSPSSNPTTSSSSSSPTATLTVSPSESPTVSRANAAPTTDGPTAAPTTPRTPCEDDPDWHKKGNSKIKCRKAAFRNTKARCRRWMGENDIPASDACKKTCGSCGPGAPEPTSAPTTAGSTRPTPPTPCEDDPDWHKKGNSRIKCRNAAFRNTNARCRRWMGENDVPASDACKKTCGSCM